MDANRFPVSVPSNFKRTIEQPAPGQIWRLSADFCRYVNAYQQHPNFKPLQGLNTDFWRSQDLPHHVLVTKPPDDDTQTVLVMPLSPRTDLVNEFDLLLPASVSQLDRDFLLETWHSFSLPTAYLVDIAGIQFSQATYNLLMDVGDAYYGRAKLPLPKTIEAAGFRTDIEVSDEKQYEIESFREQEELWSDLFKIPESEHYPHLKSIRLATASLQFAAQYHQEKTSDLISPTKTPALLIQKSDNIPRIQGLFGRAPELTTLKKWIVEDQCKIIAISGSGGIGKTALAANLAKQVQNHFKYVFWQSLRNAPKLPEIAAAIIEFLTQGQKSKDDTEDTTNQLLRYFKTYSCLVILDNFDAIDSESSEYYDSYYELLHHFQSADHQSCLVLTSRTKQISPRSKLAETLPLKGLPLSERTELLEAEGLDGTTQALTKLGEYCDGNPLALKIAASMIKEIFNNEIEEFLDTTQPETGLRGILEQQFRCLNDLERVVIYWLAVDRESVSIEQLHYDISQPVASDEILKALEVLEQRALLEREGEKYTLPPLVMEYVIDRFIDRICREIHNQKFKLFNSHAFIKAQAENYIQQSQRQQILQPILEQLSACYSPEALDDRLMQMLNQLRQTSARKPGYAATNAIAVLREIRPDALKGRDFSKLSIRQVDLRSLDLRETDFSYSDLSGAMFTKTLSSILAISYHPDGQRIATGDKSGNLKIWQIPDGELLATYQHGDGWLRTVSFSPDGKILASAGDARTIRLWDLETGKCVRILTGHKDFVRSIAFDRESDRLVSTSDDYTVKVWDVKTGDCQLTLQGHTDRVRSAVFSADGKRIASAGDDQTIRIWDSEFGIHDQVLLGHKDKIFSLVFSPDGQRLASASADCTIRLWQVDTGACQILKEHLYPIRCIAFSHDGQTIASGSEQGRIRLWDVTTGEQLKVFKGHNDWVRAIAFSPNDRWLATGSSDHTLKIWNPETQKCIRSLQGYACRVWSIAVHPEGQLLATANEDHKVRVWAVDGKCLQTFPGHTDWVRAVHFSPDGSLLASGGHDCTIRLWEIETGESRILGRHEYRVRTVRFSPDGKILATGGHDQTIRLWDVETGTTLATLRGHQGCIRKVAFSADGQLLASCSPDRSIRIWDLATHQCLREIVSCRLSAVQFHPSQPWVASAGEDERIRLWDVHTGQLLQELKGHRRWVQSIAFDPTGNYLVSGSEDQTVRVWNLQTGYSEAVLAGHTDWVRSVAFSPDGIHVFSGGEDEAARMWDWRRSLRVEKFSNPKPYQQMNITGVVGLSESQKIALEKLGAIDVDAGV